MLRATGSPGQRFPQPVYPRIGSGIYPRFILHDKSLFSLRGCKDEGGVERLLAAEIAGEGLYSIS
jgi:hypothetical protein